MFKVDESVLEKVINIFDKNKESADEDITTIQKWIEDQPHFLEPLDRRSIVNFLILNKFSIEKTKQKIDNYYTIRTKLDDIYTEMHPKFCHMQDIKEIMYYIPYSQLLNYRRIFFMKLRNSNLAENFDVIHMMRYVVSLHEMRMREDVCYGEIWVVDCKNMPSYFFFKLTPSVIFKGFIMIYQQIYSCRLKALYVVNFPSFGQALVGVIKKMVKPKLFERLYFSEDDSILKQEFPAGFLPEDFGGEGPCLEKLQEMLNVEYEKHQSLFDYLEKFKVDESRRPVKLENDEMLGFYGNFKKLNVD